MFFCAGLAAACSYYDLAMAGEMKIIDSLNELYLILFSDPVKTISEHVCHNNGRILNTQSRGKSWLATI
jgi:hypothetical protein